MTAPAITEVFVSALRVDRCWWSFGQDIHAHVKTSRRGPWVEYGAIRTPLRTTIRINGVDVCSFPAWLGYPRPLRWLFERADQFGAEYRRRMQARHNRPARQARA